MFSVFSSGFIENIQIEFTSQFTAANAIISIYLYVNVPYQMQQQENTKPSHSILWSSIRILLLEL